MGNRLARHEGRPTEETAQSDGLGNTSMEGLADVKHVPVTNSSDPDPVVSLSARNENNVRKVVLKNWAAEADKFVKKDHNSSRDSENGFIEGPVKSETVLIDIESLSVKKEEQMVEKESAYLNDLPDRALQRIFLLGVQSSWRYQGKQDNIADKMKALDIVMENVEISYLQEVDSNIEYDHDLRHLMNCAMVCKRWFKLATSDLVWEHLQGYPYFENSVRALDPLLLGRKWNLQFQKVEVVTPAHEEEAQKTVQKIECAADGNRLNFVLCVSLANCMEAGVNAAWKILRPYLLKHAKSIRILGFPRQRGLTLYHFLGEDQWTKLERLEIDQSFWKIFPEDVFEACEAWWKSLETERPEPPLPSLKQLILTGHAHSYIGPDVVHMAPNLDVFELNVERYQKFRMTSKKGKDKIGIVLNAFLATGNYRIYRTQPLVLAVRMPGPPGICRDEFWQRVVSEYSDPSKCMITVSEVNDDGYLFEAKLPMKEFMDITNADDIEMQNRDMHAGVAPDVSDTYQSELFLNSQHWLRQLIM